MNPRPGMLFVKAGLEEVLNGHLAKAIDEISRIGSDRVLATPAADLVDEKLDDYTVAPIELRSADRTTPGISDVKILVEGHDRGIQVDGSRIEVHVPFDGDAGLFEFRPNPFNHNPPCVEVRGNLLVAAYQGRSPLDQDAARNAVDGQIADVQQWLDWQRPTIDRFNEALRGHLEAAIERRRQKVLGDRQVEAFLDIPVQRRPDASPIIATGPARRRPPPTAAAASPFVPEPALADSTFGEIIEVIRATTTAMERVPATARDMTEESLRDHLLIGLNSQFGPATGESFNGKGKTDIYIPIDGKAGTVFIAECKIWRGPAGIGKAIDQLLGYLTWRDTKAALVVFQRGGSPEQVAETLTAAIRAHDAYKRDRGSDGTVFTLAAATDPNREIHIAVVHVPLLAP